MKLLELYGIVDSEFAALIWLALGGPAIRNRSRLAGWIAPGIDVATLCGESFFQRFGYYEGLG